jgi:hypothetical protein
MWIALACNQRLGNAAYHANVTAYTAARFGQPALSSPGAMLPNRARVGIGLGLSGFA